MKAFTGFFLAIILAIAVVMNVNAQSAESIWLTANTTAYKTGETVIVIVNAISATPIQGFTFQIRYDPTCLRPTNASSTIPGMNALPLPQITGLVDGSYASTTPQTVKGVLAEVRFTALGGCQTNLTLESAALAIRNEAGFAAPLAGVTLGEKEIALNIDKAVGTAHPAQPMSGSILPLEPQPAPHQTVSGWVIGLMVTALAIGATFYGVKLFRSWSPGASKPLTPYQTPFLQIKHGPQAGKNFVIDKLPCLIGRDPNNDVCLNDPNVISQHAKIFTRNDTYYLMDLGAGTFINGHVVKKSSTILKPGDVVRLGKSALFVFGL